MDINLSLYLICHHGDSEEVVKDAEVIRRVSLEKRVPVTYFFSGIEINALAENRWKIRDRLGVDVVGEMWNGAFINPRFGYHNAYLSEVGIMPFHHIPLVQPWGQDLWEDYTNFFLWDDISFSMKRARDVLGKIPVTIHPPDGIYSPAVAYALKRMGFDSVVVSSERFGSQWQKGFLYWASGLRHLVRANELQLQDARFSDAGRFVYEAREFAYRNGTSFVTSGSDIDEFNGMRGLSINDGIARLCSVGDQAMLQGVRMINCNAASHWNLKQAGIEDVWPWNNVYSMIDDGGLDFVDVGRNAWLNYLEHSAADRVRRGWDINEARGRLEQAADIALRNRYFCFSGWLSSYFEDNARAAQRLLCA
jgi:hypothetical protein